MLLYVGILLYELFVKGLGADPTPVVALAVHLGVLAWFATLWKLLQGVFCRERPTPVQAFWHPLVGAAVFAAFSIAVILLIPGGFDEENLPVAITTILQSGLVAAAGAGFVILLSLRLRELILYRRTAAALKAWRWMLGLVLLNVLVAGIFDAYQGFWVEAVMRPVLIVSALAFMAINAFRVSWVVRLTAAQKAVTICIAIGVLLSCLGAVGTLALLGSPIDARVYISQFDAGLGWLVLFVCAFGVLYCVTSCLSLVFHLPTTGDYRRREGEMAAISSLMNLVKEVLDPEKLEKTIVSVAAKAHSANVAWLATLDPKSGLLTPRVVASHNIPVASAEAKFNIKKFYQDVSSDKEPLYLPSALADHRVRAEPQDGVACLLVVPLTAHGQVFGLLFFAKSIEQGFEAPDIRAANTFAAQATLTLENARLLEARFEQARLARELAIAREVQQRLLPQRIPSHELMDMAGTSIPAQEVGGDYFDYVLLGENRLAFVVCDVSGKGTSAAFYMAGMQGVFRSVTRIAPDPETFLAHANLVLCELLDTSVFVSVVYGIVDLEQSQITLARAGHCPPVIVQCDGTATLIRPDGLGLGISKGDVFTDTLEVSTVDMKPGSVAVFYTDGLVESRDSRNEEYGYDRLRDTIAASRGHDAAGIQDAVLDDLKAFMGDDARGYIDDLTLLIFKWRNQKSDDSGLAESS